MTQHFMASCLRAVVEGISDFVSILIASLRSAMSSCSVAMFPFLGLGFEFTRFSYELR